MTITEAEKAVKKAGGRRAVKRFWKWMNGQTMALEEDGTVIVYDWDVERFIRYKCNPKNEPIEEWD